MASKLKNKKDLENNAPIDYFLTDRIPTFQKIEEARNSKSRENLKYIEKYQAISPLRSIPTKPLSKLLDPNEF